MENLVVENVIKNDFNIIEILRSLHYGKRISLYTYKPLS